MLNPTQANLEKPMIVALFIGLIASCGMITWSLSAKLDQTVLAAILLFVLSQIALLAPRAAILIVMVFLALMGDIRRLMLYGIGPVQYDVLLLIGPLIAGLLMGIAMMRGKLEAKTPLGWWVMILTLLMTLEIFNTQQGGLSVGLGGAFFYIVPMMWFWCGQAYGSKELLHNLLFRVVVPVAISAGCMGSYQAWFGFPDYQYQWLRTQSNVAVFIAGHARPFGFFISPPEYAFYCSMAASVLLAGLVLKKVRPSIVFAPFLIVCCFLQGGRTQLLGMVAGIACLWGIRPRENEATISLPRMSIALTVMFSLLFGTVLFLKEANVDERINPMVDYQVQGLLNPGESSATGHGMLFYTGILSSLTQPAGFGLGASTSAAGKLGASDAMGGGTEIDISNMFVSLGPIGGIIYLMVLFRLFQTTIRYVRRTNSLDGLALLGAFVSVSGHWLDGGQYAVTTLIWLSGGIIDRLNMDWEQENLLTS